MARQKPKPFANHNRSIDALLNHGKEGVDVLKVLKSLIEEMGGPRGFSSFVAGLALDPDSSKQVKVSVAKIAVTLLSHPAAQEADQTDIATFTDEELREALAKLIAEDVEFREYARRMIAAVDANDQKAPAGN